MFLAGWFEELLKSCKENTQEFLSVLLDRCVCWISIKVFESKAESQRIEGLSFR